MVLAVLLCVLSPLLTAADWPAISPADLAMRDFPGQPGAGAIILEKTVDSDHNKKVDEQFIRIKILTESGKDQGDIRITYDQSQSQIVDIEGRTIEPDGTIHPFSGQVFDSVVAQSRGLHLHEKSFTMPDVRVGSILDYRYRTVWHRDFPLLTIWAVQSELFVRHERFSVIPMKPLVIDWLSMGLDRQHQPVRHQPPDSSVTLEASDVAPIADEPYSLPHVERAKAVALFYSFGSLRNPQQYWTQLGEYMAKWTGKFMGKPKNLQRVAAGIIGGAHQPEDKLRAIYSYLQTLRNLTLEKLQPRGILDEDHLKQNKSVKDVLKHGYASRDEINLTFVALARAAGLNAWYVLDSSRDGHFFQKNIPDAEELDGNLAEVQVGNQDEFFDPGEGCPFGVIPWIRTAVTGMRLDDKGGTFETTAPPSTAQARIDRAGNFRLMPDGSLHGKLQVAFGGDAAFTRTFDALSMESSTHEQRLVDEVRSWLPDRSSIRLETVNGWQTSEPELKATFAVTIPDFAGAAGSRLLFSEGVLQAKSQPIFLSPHRQGMIYFHEPYVMTDDIRVELPPGYRVESTPKPAASPAGSALRYQASETADASALQWHRMLAVDNIIFPVTSYPAVRAFFAAVLQNDRRQVVLREMTQNSAASIPSPAPSH